MAQEQLEIHADGDFAENEERTHAQADLRESLLLAGMLELEAHGLGGFSLRRVAAACGVSCAAPYKHFESKESFIAAILDYIHEKWNMLEEHICTAFPKAGRDRLVELCLADIRFWLGNPHFYSVHMMGSATGGESTIRLGARAEAELLALCERTGKDHTRQAYLLRSLVYGAILMLGDGTLPNESATFCMLRSTVENLIPKENV